MDVVVSDIDHARLVRLDRRKQVPMPSHSLTAPRGSGLEIACSGPSGGAASPAPLAPLRAYDRSPPPRITHAALAAPRQQLNAAPQFIQIRQDRIWRVTSKVRRFALGESIPVPGHRGTVRS
jgi:hypothetical protein